MSHSADDTPTYNLKAVVRETRLKPDTLRAWERRYGIPQPDRSGGGHRLYSQRDIDILKWLASRQEQGLSISRAVDLWRKLEAEGQDPFEVGAAAFAPAAAGPMMAEGGTLEELRSAWVSACLRFDEAAADTVLTQAFALFPPEIVCMELLRRAMVVIGDGWHAGHVTAQQEHFASELAVRRLEILLGATPPPTRPQRILVGCPPEEMHTFSSLLITFLLRRKGWATVYLGANVPIHRFEATIAKANPHLVILSAQLLHTAASLLDMAQLLQKMHAPLGFGGMIFTLIPQLHQRIPGHYLGNRLDLAPQAVEILFSAPVPSPTAPELSPALNACLEHFLDKRSQIDLRVWEFLRPYIGGMGEMSFVSPYFAIANNALSQGVAAALRLGDMNFLGPDLAWIKSLLVERDLPLDLLGRYFAVYEQAAIAELDARGKPVLDWLHGVNTRNGLVRH